MKLAFVLAAALALAAEKTTPQCRFVDLLTKVTVEKRGLDDDALAHVEKSEKPLNPLEGDDSALPPIVRHSYREAFAKLIGEGISPEGWQEVRTQVGKLRESKQKSGTRRAEIRQETSATVGPVVVAAKITPEFIPYSNFSDRRFKTLVGRDGTTYVLYTTEDAKNGKTNRVVMIDRATGDKTYTALKSGTTGELTEFSDGRVLVVEKANVLRLWDVRAGKELGWTSPPTDSAPSYLVETPKGPAIVYGYTNRALSLNPMTKTLNGFLDMPTGTSTYYPSSDARKLYAATVVRGTPTSVVVTDIVSGTEILRETLDKTPGENNIHLALHEDKKGVVRVALRAGPDIYLLERGAKKHIPDDRVLADTQFLGFVPLPDGTVGFIAEPSPRNAMTILHYGNRDAEPLDLSKMTIAPTTVMTGADGSAMMLGFSRSSDTIEVEMTNLISKDHHKVKFPSPKLKLEELYPLANGGIGGLAWDGGSISIVQFYGPRK